VTAPHVRQGVSSAIIDGEMLVYDGVALHYLDAPATAVWLLLDGRRSEKAVARALAKAAGAPEADVLATIARLREIGLLE
jgi:hypothetical protein